MGSWVGGLEGESGDGRWAAVGALRWGWMRGGCAVDARLAVGGLGGGRYWGRRAAVGCGVRLGVVDKQPDGEEGEGFDEEEGEEGDDECCVQHCCFAIVSLKADC